MLKNNNEDLKEIVEQHLLNKDEIEIEYLADDIHWYIIGSATIIGKRNFLEAIKMCKTIQLNSSEGNFPLIDIKKVTVEGEYIIIKNEGKVFSRTGRPHKVEYYDIYRVKNGKISEMTTYLL